MGLNCKQCAWSDTNAIFIALLPQSNGNCVIEYVSEKTFGSECLSFIAGRVLIFTRCTITSKNASHCPGTSIVGI
jgi:hypothetical protein